MLNKKLVLCVTLASALGFATSASATVPGFYLGGQGGYGNANTQGFTSSDVSQASAIVTATGIPNTTTNTNNTSGIAGRLFVGYQVDPNWGVELGYTHFSNSIAKASFNGTGISTGSLTEKVTTKTNAMDLVAKGILPIENGFSVYGKAGLAYVTAKSSANASGSISAPIPNGVVTDTIAGNDSSTEHRVLPTASVGVQYDITPQLAADVSYTRIQKTGNTKIIKSTNFVGLGLSYHFG